MRPTLRIVLVLTSLLGLSFVFQGCASTAPQARFTKELLPANRVAKADTFKVTVTNAPGIDILDIERARIASIIDSKLKAKQDLNTAKTAPANLEITLHLTRYEKGNALARSLLAGLGQIHIDGVITVVDANTKETLGQFDVKKTFAWGGMYGAVTTMEDIERSFGEGVAAALTGQEEKKNDKK